MNFFIKEDYKMTIENSDTQVKATLIFTDGNTFNGIAKYHTGDTFNSEQGRKIAKAKAWRAAWNFYKKNATAKSYALEKEMNKEIDIACACNKKEKALNDYIEKLSKGES